MNRIYLVVLMLTLLSMLAISSFALQNASEPGGNSIQSWPFGDSPLAASDILPQDDFMITIGATALAPGGLVMTSLGLSFGVDPFFTDSLTEFTVLPTFAATQSLETGLTFDWWSVTVDVELLLPWSLTAFRGYLELHPPLWMILTTPWMSLEGSVGWGPLWDPSIGWGHAVTGAVDVQTAWGIPTLWNAALDLMVDSNMDVRWSFPSGEFLTNWMVVLDARSILPVFVDSLAALRAGVRAQVFLLPTFEFGFDVRLELRANALTAYGLIGAGDAGIRAEIGIDWTLGLSLFED